MDSHRHNHSKRMELEKKEAYPNGFLEEWSTSNSRKHKEPKSKDHKQIKTSKEESNMVSIILSIQNNLLLNKENSYTIRFNTGILEGNGISINEQGNTISFDKEGSYRFEISGEGSLFSDVSVKLSYSSPQFTPDIIPFSEISVPKEETKLILRGIPTILPIQKGQKITPQLKPTPDESIVLLSGTRLLIHKVA